MPTLTSARAVRQVSTHRAAIAWWLKVAQQHPHGVVPVPTAARVLGVSPARVRALIAEKRLRVVKGMPGGTDRDRFIPVLDLVDAPFRMTRGRPGVFGPEKRFTKEFLDSDPIRYKRRRGK